MARAWIPAAAVLLGLAVPGVPGPARAGGGGQPADDEPVALVVAIVDGISGAPVRGARVDFIARGGNRVGVKRPMTADGNRFLLDDTGFARGKRFSQSLEVSLPPGWVQEKEDPYDPRQPVVTRRTRVLSRTVIAWPEADLRVRVLNADGTPAGGVLLVAERKGERFSEEWLSYSHYSHEDGFRDGGRGVTGAEGRGRISGAPGIPGARYAITAWAADRSAAAEEVTLVHGTEPVSVEIRLPGEADGGGLVYDSMFISSWA